MSALQNKSMTQLRAIAQGFGVKDIFTLDEVKLKQAIELRQQEMAPAPKVEVPQPAYDVRLMTKRPAKLGDLDEIKALLKPYEAQGLQVRYTEEQWFMARGKKTDQGTLRMPLRHLKQCADRMME